MNRSPYFRLALHLAAIAAALGLGMGVRAMLPARTVTAVAPAGKDPDKIDAPPAEVPPLFPASAARPVAGCSPAELDALRSRVREINRGSNPVQEQFLLRDTLLNGIHSAEDFKRALELVEGSVEGSDGESFFYQNLVRDLVARLAEKDPAAAVGALALIKDRHTRRLIAAQVMSGWASRDPCGALAYVSTRSTGVKAIPLDPIFGELARRDPADAMARIKDYPGFGLESTVLYQWWPKDKDAALAWVNAQPPAQRTDLMRSLLEVAGHFDPESAWKLIQSLPAAEKPRPMDINNLLSNWARKDPAGALTAALGESDATRRGDILEQLGRATKFAKEDRGSTLLATITDETMRQRFLYGLATSSLLEGPHRDYQEALNLTNQLTGEKQRLDMIKSIGERWSHADAPAASEWLNTLQPGSERDAAISSFVIGTFATDPAAALSWSASIADEGKRSRRLTELYPKWIKTDPAAAAAWLSQQTQLSETDRTTLENTAPPP